jgi:hypothetical protein
MSTGFEAVPMKLKKDDSPITAEGTRSRHSFIHGLDKTKSHHWWKLSLENFTNFVIVLYQFGLVRQTATE